MRSDEHYNGLLDRAFEGEKSVSKRIQHSTVLNTKFLAAQATVNREKGSQGGGVVSCVRDTSHAKQRATAITSGCRREIVHLEAMIVESHTPSWGAQRAEGPSSADDFFAHGSAPSMPPSPQRSPKCYILRTPLGRSREHPLATRRAPGRHRLHGRHFRARIVAPVRGHGPRRAPRQVRARSHAEPKFHTARLHPSAALCSSGPLHRAGPSSPYQGRQHVNCKKKKRRPSSRSRTMPRTPGALRTNAAGARSNCFSTTTTT